MKYGFLPKIKFHKWGGGGTSFFLNLERGDLRFLANIHTGATNFLGYFAAFPSSPPSPIFNERSLKV